MKQRRDRTYIRAWTVAPPIPSWQWAADEIDYSRVPNYETPYRGKFDPDLMPFWKRPLEDARAIDVREIALIKASRCGFSENMVLTDLRYTAARAPEPCLYITGQMDLALGFLDRRVKRGMALCDELQRKYRAARVVDQDVQFPEMDFRATWVTSKTATKQDGWARIYGDEVDVWSEFSVDMVRRRAAAYPFHHIVYGGSIDPTRKGNPEESPIVKLYAESDQHVWMMPDPATGRLFAWTLDGVKWPESAKVDDEWDLEQVRAGAWYETLGGARIDEADRMTVVRSGQWVCQNPKGGRRGFKVVAAMVPFADCGFGALAARFLSAKHRMDTTASKKDRQRNTLRTYFAEYWAETHREEQEEVEDKTLADRRDDYERGQVHLRGKEPKYYIVTTADVQKYHIWFCARAWELIDGGIYAPLVEWGNVASFADFNGKVMDTSPEYVGVDIGYANRASEVADFCAEYTDQRDPASAQVIALRGSDQIQKNIIDSHVRDAVEGRSTANRSLFYELTWCVDVFRSWLVEMMAGAEGADWRIPDGCWDTREGKEYLRQVTSTRKINGDWVSPKHGQDHLWDCECEQLVLARYDGLIQ